MLSKINLEYCERLKVILEKLATNNNQDTNLITKMNIIELFNKNPQLLEIQFGEDNRNLGVIAAKLVIEWFVLMALDNKTASVQQDSAGYNIGMIATIRRFEEAVLKALDNNEASIQQ